MEKIFRQKLQKILGGNSNNQHFFVNRKQIFFFFNNNNHFILSNFFNFGKNFEILKYCIAYSQNIQNLDTFFSNIKNMAPKSYFSEYSHHDEERFGGFIFKK